MSEPTPRRVRVTSPRMHAVRRGAERPAVREIDEQTEVGAVFMRALLRSQRRLAASTLTLVALILGTLPLLFRYVPATATAHLLVVPVPWLVLGLGVYPFVVVVAIVYVRKAERVEQDFSTTLDGPHQVNEPRR